MEGQGRHLLGPWRMWMQSGMRWHFGVHVAQKSLMAQHSAPQEVAPQGRGEGDEQEPPPGLLATYSAKSTAQQITPRGPGKVPCFLV